MDAPRRAAVLLLEERAANAVAAPTVQVVDGWLVRAWPEAPFRRTSSVLPIRCGGADDERALERRFALVEEFYRRRGLPVRYQLGPITAPADLDARLAARGYAVEAPTLVQTADAARVVAATARENEHEVTVADAIDDAWNEAYGAVQGGGETSRRVEAYGRLLRRLGPPCVTALGRSPDGRAVASGFAVLERGWAGVFGMGTHPAARRRGPRDPARARARRAGERCRVVVPAGGGRQRRRAAALRRGGFHLPLRLSLSKPRPARGVSAEARRAHGSAYP